jgi:hypothetical protein
VIRYHVYGLVVQSDLDIPGLEPARMGYDDTGHVDLDITHGVQPPWAANATEPVTELRASPDDEPLLSIRRTTTGHTVFRYADGIEFFIQADTRSIWVTWPRTETLEDATTYLTGPIFGFVLRNRGHICLHGSAVAVNGKAVVFVGPAGAGKSSLAATFALGGHAVLTEDVACVVKTSSGYAVIPGYPLVRLWGPSCRNLLGPDHRLPLLTPRWNKHYLPLDGTLGRFQAEPLPLRGIFLLRPRAEAANEIATATISGQTLMMELLGNTYGAVALTRQQRATELSFLADMVRAVHIMTLTLPDDGPGLRKHREAIVASLRADQAQTVS